MSTIRNSTDKVKCGLHGFERNNYYYGKLLTVRDMRAEQAYNVGRLNTFTGFVAGAGVVCGLDIETALATEVVNEAEVEMLSVTVKPGLAHDCCGRQVVLDDEVTKKYRLGELTGETYISIYLTYSPCTTESVPLDGLESACEQECADNRILETGKVDFVLEAPTERYKSVPLVDFPSKREVGEQPRLLADAPPKTFFIERWPDANVEEAKSIAVLVLGGEGDRRFYNASVEEVTLDEGDLLLSSDGIRYAVTRSEARRFPGRTGALEPEALVLAFSEPVEVLAEANQKVAGWTSASPEADRTLEVSVDGGDTKTATFEDDHTFAVEFDFDDFEVGDTFRLSGELEVDIENETESIASGAWGVVVEEKSGTEEIDTPRGLVKIARSYYENKPLTECKACEEETTSDASGIDADAVLVGSVVREEDDETWERARFERGPQVYGNDLLYAGLARHGTDFRNPHETTLELKRSVEDAEEEREVASAANLHSGRTYVRGQTLLLSNLNFPEGHRVHTADSDELGPGSVVEQFEVSDGTAEIDTVSFEAGDYVVTNSDFVPILFQEGRAQQAQEEISIDEFKFGISEREEPIGPGAILTVTDLPTDEHDVQFASSDGSVSIEADGRQVDFRALGGSRPVAEPSREQALWNKGAAFWEFFWAIRQEIPSNGRGGPILALSYVQELVRRTVDALETEVYNDSQQYVEFFIEQQPFSIDIEADSMSVVELERGLIDSLTQEFPTFASSRAWQLYADAVSVLEEAAGLDDISVRLKSQRLTEAQENVSNAVKLLLFLPPIDKGERDIGGVPPVFGTATRRSHLVADLPIKAVPNVLNLTREEAIERLDEEEWSYRIISRAAGDTRLLRGVGVNDVIEQSPEPETQMTEGTEIVFTVIEPPSTERIQGIGNSRRSELAKVNVLTVGDLSRTPIETIIEATGVPEETAEEWKETAERYVIAYELTRAEGIGIGEAEALVVATDVRSLSDLRSLDADEIKSQAEEAVDAGRLSESARTRLTNVDWDVVTESLERFDPR